MDCLLTASTVVAALGSGLIAGVFFAFAAFVLAALSRLPAPAGITAMQTMIAAIKSPLFLVVFFGTAALAALLGIAATLKWSEPGALYLLIGSLLYLNGPFGVTLLKNLPLNNHLAAVTPGSIESAIVWKEFRDSWGLWNHVRWIAALGAAAAFIWALVEGGTLLSTRVALLPRRELLLRGESGHRPLELRHEFRVGLRAVDRLADIDRDVERHQQHRAPGSALPSPCMKIGTTGTFGCACARWPMPFLKACSVSGSPRVPSGKITRISPRSSASSASWSGLPPSLPLPRFTGMMPTILLANQPRILLV